MSRIHEALKKAEEERALNSVVPFQPFGGGTHTCTVAIPSSQPAIPLSDGLPNFTHLRPEDIYQKCAKPTWNPDPAKVVFREAEAFTPCAEQFRTLHSRLYGFRTSQKFRTLLITSALPEEGKTFVATNLAHAIARQDGRRALLIDADLRASKVHVALGAPAGPGLSDYLAGDAEELGIIQADSQGSLFLIPAGKHVPNPAELLASARLKRLIDGLAPLFDWVIFDAPPVLPVADANLIASLCDGVLLVVRAGYTAFDLAQTACQEFKGKNLIGVVLNRAEEEAAPYAYSYYYGRGRNNHQ